MKLNRVLGSLAVAGTLTAASFGFAAASPAASNPTDLTFSFNPASNSQVPGNLPPNDVPVQITASCPPNNLELCTVSGLSATLTNGAGGAVTLPAPQKSGSGTSSESVSYTWNTQPTTSANGRYSLVATATEGGLAGGQATSQISLLVNNAPSAPTGVKAALNPSAGNTPLVTWNANPEPDVTGYEVFRSGSGSTAAAFSTAAGVTSLQDSTAPKGVPVSYVVVAVRSSPVWSTGITSCGGAAPCSNPPTANETPAVTPPAPATTTQQPMPSSVATADPPKPVAAAAGGTASSGKGLPTTAPITLGAGTAPEPIVAPSLPDTVIQQPEPNVVQFAPLLPYSGKIPEVAVTSSVPAPVQASTAPVQQAASVAVPGIGKVKTVDAVKYIAAAIVLIVGAVHLTRLARRLTAAT
jgi:hypothetical protein